MICTYLWTFLLWYINVTISKKIHTYFRYQLGRSKIYYFSTHFLVLHMYLIFWKENVDHITLLQLLYFSVLSLDSPDKIPFHSFFFFFSYNFLKDACCFCCWLVVVRRLWSISNGSLTKEWDWHEIVLLAPIFPQSLLNTKISIVLYDLIQVRV